MEYLIKTPEGELEASNFAFNGQTHCAVFVQGVTGLPNTTLWKKGRRVIDAKPGEILRGTAIATFDDDGKYPTVDCPKDMKQYKGGACGRHAAIYISHSENGINVYDQWAGSGGVHKRLIHAAKTPGSKRVNEASFYYTIEY